MKLLKIIIVLILMLSCFQCTRRIYWGPTYPPNEYIKAGTDLDRIKELIEQGEDMNELDRKTGLAPLHAIAESIAHNTIFTKQELSDYTAGELKKMRDTVDKYYKAAELLLNNGADVNVKTRHGATVLNYCMDIRCEKFFLKYGADVNINSPLHAAACRGSIERVKLYIANGAHINARDSKGRTPLFCSVDSKVTEILIKNGADVNARDLEGRTPLFCGVGSKVTETLIKNGADAKVRDINGETPLFYWRNNNSALELMIKNGADVNAKNIKGETALFQPFLKVERVKLFVKYKINVNEQDNTGKTVLHHILMKRKYPYDKLVLELLKSGAKVDIKDNDGKTPLDIISERLEKSHDLKDIYELVLKYKGR